MALDDDPELLRWLHDCELQYLRLDSAERNTRTLTLLIECPPDLGLPEWNGCRAKIVFYDLIQMKYAFHGNQIGPEPIDSLDRMEQSSDESDLYGPDCRKYSIGFCTGSEIELICKRVTVELAGE